VLVAGGGHSRHRLRSATHRSRPAPGAPGARPTWINGAKDMDGDDVLRLYMLLGGSCRSRSPRDGVRDDKTGSSRTTKGQSRPGPAAHLPIRDPITRVRRVGGRSTESRCLRSLRRCNYRMLNSALRRPRNASRHPAKGEQAGVGSGRRRLEVPGRITPAGKVGPATATKTDETCRISRGL
jgi:hypothetical protein